MSESPGRVRSLLMVYGSTMRVGLLGQFQYRTAAYFYMIGMLAEPVIYLVVWSTVARSTGGTVGGYGARDFAAYYIVLMLVNQATFTWVMYEFDYRIREGAFSAELLHPVHPIHADIATNLSSKVVNLPFIVVAAAGLAFLCLSRLKLLLLFWHTKLFGLQASDSRSDSRNQVAKRRSARLPGRSLTKWDWLRLTGVRPKRGLLQSEELIRVLRWANNPSRNYMARPAARRRAEESG